MGLLLLSFGLFVSGPYPVSLRVTADCEFRNLPWKAPGTRWDARNQVSCVQGKGSTSRSAFNGDAHCWGHLGWNHQDNHAAGSTWVPLYRPVRGVASGLGSREKLIGAGKRRGGASPL